jgi:hypothetical protein
LGVLPDAGYVREEEDCGVFVDGGAGRESFVGFDGTGVFEGFAGG